MIHPMKTRDRIALINRAVAALETPGDLNDQDIDDLIDDLETLADEFHEEDENEVRN